MDMGWFQGSPSAPQLTVVGFSSEISSFLKRHKYTIKCEDDSRPGNIFSHTYAQTHTAKLLLTINK